MKKFPSELPCQNCGEPVAVSQADWTPGADERNCPNCGEPVLAGGRLHFQNEGCRCAACQLVPK